MCFLPYTEERETIAPAPPTVYMCFTDGGYKQLIAGAVKRSIQPKIFVKKKEHNNFFFYVHVLECPPSSFKHKKRKKKKQNCVFDKTTCKYHHLLLLLSIHDQRWTHCRTWSNAPKRKKRKKKSSSRTSLGSVGQAVCLQKPKRRRRRRRGAKDGVHTRTHALILRNKTRESGRSFSCVCETTTNYPPTHASQRTHFTLFF